MRKESVLCAGCGQEFRVGLIEMVRAGTPLCVECKVKDKVQRMQAEIDSRAASEAATGRTDEDWWDSGER